MKTFNLSDFIGNIMPQADMTAAFVSCFETAKKCGENVQIIIPPGEYHLNATEPVELFSCLSVFAEGASFYFPENMDFPKHRTMFLGTDIQNFFWQGGAFYGFVYDVPPALSRWRPDACSRGIAVQTSEHGVTSNLCFRNIKGKNCAGSVVSVYGCSGSPKNRAKNIEVFNCQFENCGKFMWDYGYLWEKMVFPEHFSAAEYETALQYLPDKNISGAVTFCGEYIQVENMPAIKYDARFPRDNISFFGSNLPPEIKKGTVYFVLHEEQGKVWFSEQVNGSPCRTSIPANCSCRLFRNMFDVFHWTYAPVEQGPGKGAVDLVCCQNLNVSNSEFSANGDSMHIKDSSEVVFSNNRIAGSRMGAFFLAFDCDHVTATGNVVNGTNGSRVLTVERGCHEIVISDNVFSGGGRGCWFNSNENLILTGNVFDSNVLKGVPEFGKGRRSPFSGAFEKYPELYFAHGGKGYGNIIIKSNIICATPTNTESSVLFQSMGHDIIMSDNIFRSGTSKVSVAEDVRLIQENNSGISGFDSRDVQDPL